MEGSGRVLLDGEVRELAPWDVLRVAPEVVRAFEGGPDGLRIIAIGGPKPEGGDGVRSDAPGRTSSQHARGRRRSNGRCNLNPQPPGAVIASLPRPLAFSVWPERVNVATAEGGAEKRKPRPHISPDVATVR